MMTFMCQHKGQSINMKRYSVWIIFREIGLWSRLELIAFGKYFRFQPFIVTCSLLRSRYFAHETSQYTRIYFRLSHFALHLKQKTVISTKKCCRLRKAEKQNWITQQTIQKQNEIESKHFYLHLNPFVERNKQQNWLNLIRFTKPKQKSRANYTESKREQ